MRNVIELQEYKKKERNYKIRSNLEKEEISTCVW